MWFNYIGRMGGAWVIKTLGWGEKRRFEPIGICHRRLRNMDAE
jgi:hypothetical protein